MMASQKTSFAMSGEAGGRFLFKRWCGICDGILGMDMSDLSDIGHLELTVPSQVPLPCFTPGSGIFSPIHWSSYLFISFLVAIKIETVASINRSTIFSHKIST